MFNSKNSKVVWLMLFLVVILLGIIGWLKFENYQLMTKSPNNFPKPSVEPINKWVTYTNQLMGFSLKYPSNYFRFVDSNPKNVGDSLSASTINDQPGIGNLLEPKEIWLYVSVAEGINRSLSESTDPANSPYEDYKRTERSIGGQAGYKISFTIPYDPVNTPHAWYVYQGIVIKDKKSVDIRISSYDKNLLLSNEDLFDQILSTAQFNR